MSALLCPVTVKPMHVLTPVPGTLRCAVAVPAGMALSSLRMALHLMLLASPMPSRPSCCLPDLVVPPLRTYRRVWCSWCPAPTRLCSRMTELWPGGKGQYWSDGVGAECCGMKQGWHNSPCTARGVQQLSTHAVCCHLLHTACDAGGQWWFDWPYHHSMVTDAMHLGLGDLGYLGCRGTRKNNSFVFQVCVWALLQSLGKAADI